ncbi:MAG: outer membrane protein assembly factor BamE [Burkholderiales bacterium]|nr:outer membrane protein assembly factor BamE [Burkholderiales bacterium]
MSALLRLAAALATAALAGCARAPLPVPEIVKPYRITIQQGNYITREMVEQLKPGMTKEQVRFVLGTPLVTDIFHADRWDYVFFRETPDGRREQRNFAVIFHDGRLARVIGDLLPAEPAQAAAPKPQPAKPAPQGSGTGDPSAGARPAPPVSRGSATADVAPPLEPGSGGNSRAASDPPTPLRDPEPGPQTAAADAQTAPSPPQDTPARGFFGRLLERIGF